MRLRQMAVGSGLTVIALAGLAGLVWFGLARSQNGADSEPIKAPPVPVQPVQAQVIQVKPIPAPAKPAQPVPPDEQPGDARGGPGGGAARPEIRVVPQPLGWEYRVVEFLGRDTDEHTKTLNQLAAEGWEYVGLINLFSTQTNGTTNGQPSGLVAFRRPKFRPPPGPVVPRPAVPPEAEPRQIQQIRPIPANP